ncbi:hypothetical protein L7F56_004718 [Escherichia coli]|nr:hypothetical protein [Escherichia coli]EIV7084741.1 hypothetical protein [Escherichia coli]HCN7911619.1 hypothetical protein [Escherichia coli]HCN7912479.1 hypothetical protein [Escherichia coli]HDZ7347895.1 hypothetical protein [Escherichia coli]
MNLKSIVPKAAGLAAWIVGIIYSGFALSVLWGGVADHNSMGYWNLLLGRHNKRQ